MKKSSTPSAAAAKKKKRRAPVQTGTMRIVVTNIDTGKNRIVVNLPMSLAHTGIKLGVRFAPGLRDEEMTAIAKAVKAGETGKIFEATNEAEREHVEIFVE